MNLEALKQLNEIPMPQVPKKRFPAEIVLSEYITSMQDVQLIQRQRPDFLEVSHKLVESVANFGLKTVLLTDSPDQLETPNLSICTVPMFKDYQNVTLYFRRWEMAFQFLKQHPEIKKLALVDVGDVTMLRYPFDEMEPGKLYFGDERSDLSVYIIQKNIGSPAMADFFEKYETLQLLNPGVIAGDRQTVLAYLGAVAVELSQRVAEIQLTGQGHVGYLEMALLNYVAYRDFATQLVHGRQVTSRFLYQEKTSTAWFKHK